MIVLIETGRFWMAFTRDQLNPIREAPRQVTCVNGYASGAEAGSCHSPSDFWRMSVPYIATDRYSVVGLAL
jgi:hypothetical protein